MIELVFRDGGEFVLWRFRIERRGPDPERAEAVRAPSIDLVRSAITAGLSNMPLEFGACYARPIPGSGDWCSPEYRALCARAELLEVWM